MLEYHEILTILVLPMSHLIVYLLNAQSSLISGNIEILEKMVFHFTERKLSRCYFVTSFFFYFISNC